MEEVLLVLLLLQLVEIIILETPSQLKGVDNVIVLIPDTGINVAEGYTVVSDPTIETGVLNPVSKVVPI